MMCSEKCPCPPSVAETWQKLDQKTLKSFDRIDLSKNSLSLSQEQELTDNWFNADIIPLVFYQDDGDTRYSHIWRTVSTYESCYEKNLKPMFNGEVSDIDLSDPKMKDIMEKQKNFFEEGGF